MSGLTPDEHAVYQMILEQASDQCLVLSDYPTTSSVVKIIGRRLYFESTLPSSETASNLRMVGQKSVRNVYIPKDGFLRFRSLKLPSNRRLADLLGRLGEWCYLRPESPTW